MTSQNPEKRWGNNGKNYIGCDKFMKAIIKYGWDNFEHEIFENNLTKEEAELLESELILNYKTTDDEFGYNLQSGGNSPTFSEDTKRKMSISVLCVETEQQFYGAAEASVKTGIHFSNINKCCRGQAHTAGGYRWKYADKDKQEEFEKEMRELELNNPIQKIICIETGQIYNSITEAASLLGIKSPCHISSCLKGRRKTCGGYHWKYYEEELNESLNLEREKEELEKKNKEIVCIETQIKYESCCVAEKKTGIDKDIIKNCCDHVYRTASGYHWEYVNRQNTDNFSSTRESSKKVICLETGEVFDSAADVQKKTGINKTSVRNCCKGLYKTAGKEKKHFQYYYDYCMENKEKVLYENIN